MEKVTQIASYISERYQRSYGEPIGEMKLHKLLYFAQRESFVQTGEPLFSEEFEAWTYGPVMVEIRQLYKDGQLTHGISDSAQAKYSRVFDVVFEQYAPKSAWSLSNLSHGERSWCEARKGCGRYDKCAVKMKTADIAKDAERIKMRRFMLQSVLPRMKQP